MDFEFTRKNDKFGFQGKTIDSNEQLSELPVEFLERMTRAGVLVKNEIKSKKLKEHGEDEK